MPENTLIKQEKPMKVLLLNGSPRPKGNTAAALAEMEKIFAQEGIETETVQIGAWPIRGCTACRCCYKTGKCVHDDGINELAEKLRESDGLVVASPVRLRQFHPHRRSGPDILQQPF